MLLMNTVLQDADSPTKDTNVSLAPLFTSSPLVHLSPVPRANSETGIFISRGTQLAHPQCVFAGI